MEYRVEALAAAAGLRIDTLRFYQTRGLLPAPKRRGRIAIYGDEHLTRLRRIRELQRQGLTLAQIRRVVVAPPAAGQDPLLQALVTEAAGDRSLTREELAAEAGVPLAIIRAVETAGLIEPLHGDGEDRFSEADLEMARAGLILLESGVPLQSLLQIAVDHARHTRDVCDTAVELFDQSIRKSSSDSRDDEAIAAAFQALLPQVTRLVAVHFQRTLVSRALNRLHGKEGNEALEAALAATESANLEIAVTWR